MSHPEAPAFSPAGREPALSEVEGDLAWIATASSRADMIVAKACFAYANGHREKEDGKTDDAVPTGGANGNGADSAKRLQKIPTTIA